MLGGHWGLRLPPPTHAHLSLVPCALLWHVLWSRVDTAVTRHGVCFTLRVHLYLITNVPRLCGPGVPGEAIEFEMIVDRTVLRDAANATSSARSVRRSGI